MGGDPLLARSLLALLCVCCVLSPRHVHTDVHTDGAYLLLAGGARCVRGRVAKNRADPMVASSSAAATATFTPKFGTGELGSELAELVGEEGVDARPSRIEALRVAGRPGTPEVACA